MSLMQFSVASNPGSIYANSGYFFCKCKSKEVHPAWICQEAQNRCLASYPEIVGNSWKSNLSSSMRGAPRCPPHMPNRDAYHGDPLICQRVPEWLAWWKSSFGRMKRVWGSELWGWLPMNLGWGSQPHRSTSLSKTPRCLPRSTSLNEGWDEMQLRSRLMKYHPTPVTGQGGQGGRDEEV